MRFNRKHALKLAEMWLAGMRKERSKGRKAYNGGQEVISIIFDVCLLQPTSSLSGMM